MLFRGGKRAVFWLLLIGVSFFSFYWFNEGKIVFSQSLPSGKEGLAVGLEVGMLAPDFTLRDLKGKEAHLSHFRGKGVILNFWSTWCKPCRAELPLIESFYRTNGAQVEVLSININRETDGTVKDFAQGMGLSFPVLLDFQKEVARQYKIFAVPTSFLIDKKGVIVKKFFGEIELQPHELLSMINGSTALH